MFDTKKLLNMQRFGEVLYFLGLSIRISSSLAINAANQTHDGASHAHSNSNDTGLLDFLHCRWQEQAIGLAKADVVIRDDLNQGTFATPLPTVLQHNRRHLSSRTRKIVRRFRYLLRKGSLSPRFG